MRKVFINIQNAYMSQVFLCFGKEKALTKESSISNRISCLFLVGFFKFLVELVDTAIRRNASLFASVEWVAVRAGFNFDFVSHRGATFKSSTAADASDLAMMVGWMDSLFHFQYSFRLATQNDS